MKQSRPIAQKYWVPSMLNAHKSIAINPHTPTLYKYLPTLWAIRPIFKSGNDDWGKKHPMF